MKKSVLMSSLSCGGLAFLFVLLAFIIYYSILAAARLLQNIVRNHELFKFFILYSLIID